MRVLTLCERGFVAAAIELALAVEDEDERERSIRAIMQFLCLENRPSDAMELLDALESDEIRAFEAEEISLQLRRAGDIDKAVGLLRRLTCSTPLGTAYLARGLANLDATEDAERVLAQAMEQLERLEDRHERASVIWILAQTQRRLGREAESYQTFEWAVTEALHERRETHRHGCLMEIVMARVDCGDPAGAEQTAEDIGLDPDGGTYARDAALACVAAGYAKAGDQERMARVMQRIHDPLRRQWVVIQAARGLARQGQWGEVEAWLDSLSKGQGGDRGIRDLFALRGRLAVASEQAARGDAQPLLHLALNTPTRRDLALSEAVRTFSRLNDSASLKQLLVACAFHPHATEALCRALARLQRFDR